jgi:hypothetical protein
VDADTRLTRATIEPEAYAPLVTCPLLFMNASNDHHGRLDLAMRTLDLTKQSRMLREIYTPRYVHHIDPAEGRDLPMWMDLHLKGVGARWPASPTIRVGSPGDGEGPPRVTVTVDRPGDVEGVRVHYGLNNPWPVSRFYRTATATPARAGAAEYAAAVPILADDDTLYAFANVAYRGGVRLSTRLVRASAKDLPGVRATLRRSDVIDPMTTPDAWFWWRAGTDPMDDTEMYPAWTGPAGERGFTHGPPSVFSFATVALGDAQFHTDGDQPLLIDAWADTLPKTLDVEVAIRFFQPTQVSYKAHPKLAGLAAGRWVTLRLIPHDFTDDKGEPLASWKEVDFLWLSGFASPGKRAVFANLRWAQPG